jgi:hypothetical protein
MGTKRFFPEAKSSERLLEGWDAGSSVSVEAALWWTEIASVDSNPLVLISSYTGIEDLEPVRRRF